MLASSSIAARPLPLSLARARHRRGPSRSSTARHRGRRRAGGRPEGRALEARRELRCAAMRALHSSHCPNPAPARAQSGGGRGGGMGGLLDSGGWVRGARGGAVGRDPCGRGVRFRSFLNFLCVSADYQPGPKCGPPNFAHAVDVDELLAHSIAHAPPLALRLVPHQLERRPGLGAAPSGRALYSRTVPNFVVSLNIDALKSSIANYPCLDELTANHTGVSKVVDCIQSQANQVDKSSLSSSKTPKSPTSD